MKVINLIIIKPKEGHLEICCFNFGNHTYIFIFISLVQGGIKAVIWTDVIQYSIMVTSVLAILIKVLYGHF